VFPLQISSITALCKGLSLNQGDASTEYFHINSLLHFIVIDCTDLQRTATGLILAITQRCYSWHLGKVW